MNTKTRRTFDQIFQHPMTHNLEWRDVRALFESIGQVEQEHNGNWKVTLGEQAVVFHSPSDSDTASSDQVSQMRHLLKDTQPKGKSKAPTQLLVIDHQEAKVYASIDPGTEPTRIASPNLEGHKSHVHSAHDYRSRNEKPDHNAYFQEVAKSLQSAERILIFGSGEGSSSAMDLFVTWLQDHDQPLSGRVFQTETIDQGHMTEGQILARAKEICEQ